MATPFTFVHAADLHLGTPFTGMGEVSPAFAAILRDATLVAFDNLVRLCLNEEASFLVIAGDVWDGPGRSIRALARFNEGVRKLGASSIPVFVSAGNHDPLRGRGWAAAGEKPPNLTVFPDRKPGLAEVRREGELLAVVHGMSYHKEAVTEDLASRITRKNPAGFEIGVLHATVGSGAGHEPYAPTTVDALRASGLDYWALGHVHTRGAVCAEAPLACYPGNAQALSVRETGARGALVVRVDEGGKPSTEFFALDAARFAEVVVDLSKLDQPGRIPEFFRLALEKERSDAEGRALILALKLTGRSALYRDLGREGEMAELLALLREEAEGCDPPVWLDRLENRLSPPLDLARVEASGTLDGEAARQARTILEDGQALEDFFAALNAPLAAKPALRRLLEDDGGSVQAQEEFLAARDLALDLLSGEEP